MTENETTKGNAILSHNADEIAALVTIVAGAGVAAYMLVNGIDVNETAVGVLTMMMGTPLGYLFGKA
ncbi:hypothetical protein [Methanolobus psychrotolerans]|uniref:hypothetical protein n=1 Tax=Methanolobus psychrotolerans TaxID=1874706 RepID=UPI000B915E24|nr:hypothetical protein [Methanolobus psychrotolerans]